MKPRLLVLDQWARQALQAGTNKSWLYNGFDKIFDTCIVNADTSLMNRLVGFSSLIKALISRPTDLRCEYHRQLEWAAKTPSAFLARTIRFQKALDRLSGYDATFQVGCLFGPMTSSGRRPFPTTTKAWLWLKECGQNGCLEIFRNSEIVFWSLKEPPFRPRILFSHTAR